MVPSLGNVLSSKSAPDSCPEKIQLVRNGFRGWNSWTRVSTRYFDLIPLLLTASVPSTTSGKYVRSQPLSQLAPPGPLYTFPKNDRRAMDHVLRPLNPNRLVTNRLGAYFPSSHGTWICIVKSSGLMRMRLRSLHWFRAFTSGWQMGVVSNSGVGPAGILRAQDGSPSYFPGLA